MVAAVAVFRRTAPRPQRVSVVVWRPSQGAAMNGDGKERSTVVLDVRGLRWASEKSVVETVLGRRPGVRQVEANPVAQTATVVFDPSRTSLAELRRWVEECGFHCAGQSVPAHLCDPMAEPDPPAVADQRAAAVDVPPAEPPVHMHEHADGGR